MLLFILGNISRHVFSQEEGKRCIPPRPPRPTDETSGHFLISDEAAEGSNGSGFVYFSLKKD